MLRPLLYVIGTLLVTQAAVIATSVYLHRGLAHRALNRHPFADWVFRFVLWFTTGQNRREWVAVHRKHHAFTDTERDPHSPLVTASGRSSSGTSITTCARAATPRPSPAGPRTSGTTCGTVCSSTRHARRGGRHRGGHVDPGPRLGPAPGRHPLRALPLRAGPVDQRPRPLVGPEKLRQQLGHQPARARLAHRRREPAQQPPRLSLEPQVQRGPLRVRPVVGGDPRAHAAAPGAPGGRLRRAAPTRVSQTRRHTSCSFLS